jgi:hypothetical protein
MRSVRVYVWICLALGLPAGVGAQGRQSGSADPDRAREIERLVAVTRAAFTSDVLAGPVVTDSPFSADATTTVTQVLSDGTHIEQTTSARFFRDRAGRVRREQTIVGLGAIGGVGNMQTITIAPDSRERHCVYARPDHAHRSPRATHRHSPHREHDVSRQWRSV